jgi:chemotaxis protein methyltransferase CheR
LNTIQAVNNNSATPTQTVKSGISLDSANLARFRKLLSDRFGFFFSDNRQTELENGIKRAFAASTCADLDEFYQLLQDPIAGTVEMDLLANSVTVAESHFFRDTAQFDALYSEILPHIIERKRNSRTLRIWSAGCACGEEPYSIAILLRELMPDLQDWSITILGSDINSLSLERARAGVYSYWAFREERAMKLLPKYFQQNANRYELDPEIRHLVSFSKLNLAESCYPSYETNTTLMDLILCRNVTIYLSEEVTRWVVDRFYDALMDGGWLAVGHSEPSVDIYKRFRVRNFPNTLLYQRVPQTAALRWPLKPTATPIPPPPVVTKPKQTGMLPPLPADNPAQYDSQASLKLVEEENVLERAKAMLEYGHSQDAIILLKKVAKSDPSNLQITLLLAQAYASLGEWEEAIRYCRNTIDIDKLNIDAYYTLGLVLQHQGKLDQAVEVMRRVVYIDRNSVLGHYGLANLLKDCGLIPQAQKSLDNALRLLTDRPPDQVIEGSNGITVARLRDAIIRMQQSLITI